MHPDDVRLIRAKAAVKDERGNFVCPTCRADLIEPGKQMPGDAGTIQSKPLRIFLYACGNGHDVVHKRV